MDYRYVNVGFYNERIGEDGAFRRDKTVPLVLSPRTRLLIGAVLESLF